MDEGAVEIIEVRSSGASPKVESRVYAVRPGPIGRLVARLTIALGLALGLLVLVPIVLLGLALGLLVVLVGVALAGLARLRAALTPTGRRNVRVIR